MALQHQHCFQLLLLFFQMKGRLYLSTVLIMDATTTPHALTHGLPLRSKILTAHTPPAKFLTGTVCQLVPQVESCVFNLITAVQ